MGTDCTIYVELKVGNMWHQFDVIRTKRNYDMFGFMAGVRRDVTPVAPVRGLPTDLSMMASMAIIRDTDLHTWLSSSEVAEVEEEYKKQNEGAQWPYYCFEAGFLNGGYLSGNEWHKSSLPDGADDFRWVVVFDS